MTICGRTVRHVRRPYDERLLGYVLAAQGLSLEMLFDATQDFATRDEIYLLIATGALSVDIRSASLREPGRVLVFAPGDEHLQKIAGADGRFASCSSDYPSGDGS